MTTVTSAAVRRTLPFAVWWASGLTTVGGRCSTVPTSCRCYLASLRSFLWPVPPLLLGAQVIVESFPDAATARVSDGQVTLDVPISVLESIECDIPLGLRRGHELWLASGSARVRTTVVGGASGAVRVTSPLAPGGRHCYASRTSAGVRPPASRAPTRTGCTASCFGLAWHPAGRPSVRKWELVGSCSRGARAVG